MLELTHLDLRTDPHAQQVIKNETVTVEFATDPGVLMSLEGPNRYACGDALITSANGERWVVARARFEAKYLPLETTLRPGMPGAYRNRPAIVLARQMHEAFTLARAAGSDVLQGVAGDWVMQYAPGDYGVVQAARFDRVYQLAS
ncbi:PGDYG domain-containing protein [Paraburkholderia hayleyella]|uniref:PGDYG domain-containing protein n=1 Tax=Paraburkholderia hayleyella TaxID=2152889 RepID=UPI001292B6D2|nr:PGDYG domain-containing protein [Paraburkholderia hayleyella]